MHLFTFANSHIPVLANTLEKVCRKYISSASQYFGRIP